MSDLLLHITPGSPAERALAAQDATQQEITYLRYTIARQARDMRHMFYWYVVTVLCITSIAVWFFIQAV